MPFTIASKIFRNKLKEMQNLYSKNYETLLKEIKEDIDKWKDIPQLWMGRLNSVKMAIFPKLIYLLNAIPIEIPASYFAEIDKLSLKLIWKYKRPQIP